MKRSQILKITGGMLAGCFVDRSSGQTTQSSAFSIDPKVDALLRRYVEALGGISAMKAVTTQRITGTIERFGNKVPHLRTQKQPNLLLLETKFPKPGTLKQGFNGSVGWVQHPTQGGRRLAGKELAEFTSQAWLHPALHLAETYPIRKLIGPRSIDGKDLTAAALGKKKGSPAETWFFDASTTLLSRIEQTVDGGPKGEISVTMILTDYRRVDGLMTPFCIKTIVGAAPPSESVLTIESVEHNLSIDDAVFQPLP